MKNHLERLSAWFGVDLEMAYRYTLDSEHCTNELYVAFNFTSIAATDQRRIDSGGQFCRL